MRRDVDCVIKRKIIRVWHRGTNLIVSLVVIDLNIRMPRRDLLEIWPPCFSGLIREFFIEIWCVWSETSTLEAQDDQHRDAKQSDDSKGVDDEEE